VERINYITVFPSPTASFTSNLTLGCVPTTINFTDLSTPSGAITNWEWDFGDGGTSTQPSPSHTYTSVGFFNVTLTVTSNTGCKNTISAGSYIRIVGGVTTDFTFSPPTTCRPPFNIAFQNLSDGPGNINYTWDFGNSTGSNAMNPTGTYAAPGTYTVSLSAVSDLGCTGSTTKTVTINTTTTDFNAPTNICLNQPITFQNNSSPSPVSASWNFADGTVTSQINPSKTFLIAGDFNVRLINQYAGCMDSAFQMVHVEDKPAVAFTAVDTANCQAPFTVQFTDQTPGASQWLWDFGDGNTSTLQNPSHTYTTNGDFNVSLTVTTAGGCSNTLVKTPYVLVRPISIVLNLPTGGCEPLTFTPVATIVSLEPITTWQWNFGNGNTNPAQTSAQNPPAQLYPTAGQYDVSLTVGTASGCSVTQTALAGVRVGRPPIVNFDPPPPVVTCANVPVQFTDLTDFGPFNPFWTKEWVWDFDDGTTSGEQNPLHEFQDTGFMVVRLTALNNGCPGIFTRTIEVRPPIARFEYTVNCVTGLVTFTNTSLFRRPPAPGSTPLEFLWDFGSGITSPLETPVPQTFTGPGIYPVRLTVTNGICTDDTLVNITITGESAEFSITRNPVCKNEPFTMQATQANPANIARYQWVIGTDTIPVEGATVSWSIPTVGVYDVTLVLTDINGCKSKLLKPGFLSINGPTASFTASTGACLGKAFTFDASASTGNITRWAFDFGDGTKDTLTALPLTHTYNLLGAFDVSLTVIDNAGCTDSYALPNPIFVTNPRAGFRADTFYCPQAPLQFIDTSSGVGLTYQWTFGDGNSATVQNPQHAYPAGDADYSVKLKITDISGCSDSVTKTNYIKVRLPKAAFAIRDTTTICPPLRTSFTFQGSDYASLNWDFGDGSTSPAESPTHFYGQYGHFIPVLTLTGNGGCTSTASASVTIHNPGSSQINYGPLTTACNSLNVDFNLVLPPGFKFYFAFGDGTVDSTRRTSFSHLYPRPSLNTPLLFIIDTAYGCQSVIAGNPRIDVLGAIPLFGKDKEEFCDAGLVQFKDFTTKNEAIQTMTWHFGDGQTSTQTDPSHNYTQPGLYEVRLDVTTVSNCSSSYLDTVLVYRTPAPSILSRDTICLNTAEQFTAVLAQADTAIKYQWTFGNGQTGTDSISIATYTTAGDFPITLTTTNKIGCSANDTKSIHVAVPPTATPVQNPITIISGGNTSLAMTYTGNIANYFWSPETQLSCTDCPVPIATPRFTTKYNVQISDIYGCRNTADVNVIVVCNDLNYFVPNTFSPNGDGMNETFFARGTGLFSIKSLTVFNRWGQVVFEKKNMAINDPAAGWNGTIKGQKASPDVYVYIMEILCDNGTVVPVKGNVTLLR
jgi:gliding motility-associated-like protein